MSAFFKVTDDKKFCSKCGNSLERGTLYKQETISSPRYWLEFTGECCMSESDLAASTKIKASESTTSGKKVTENGEQIGWI